MVPGHTMRTPVDVRLQNPKTWQCLAEMLTYCPAHNLCSQMGMLCRPVGTRSGCPARSLLYFAVGGQFASCPRVFFPDLRAGRMVHPQKASPRRDGCALSDQRWTRGTSKIQHMVL